MPRDTARTRLYRGLPVLKELDGKISKLCSKCGEYLPTTSFSPSDKSGLRQPLRSRCKECEKRVRLERKVEVFSSFSDSLL